MLEDLHVGARVMGSDGEHLGELTRIVVGPTYDVEMLVVDPGLVESGNLLKPGGWEAPRERVLPVDMLESVSDDEVRLSCTKAEFESRPLFERKEYAAVEVSEAPGQPRFHLGDLVNYIASVAGTPYVAPAKVTLNEEAGAVDIGEGMPVWRIDPHEQVGVVERVLADRETQQVTALVVRRRGFAGDRVMLPVAAIADVSGDTVHVTLTDEQFDALPPYD